MKRNLHKNSQTSEIIRTIIKQDNYFQRAEVIKRNREKRTQHGQFLVEGVAQVSLAVKHNWRIVAFLYSIEGTLSHWAQELVDSRVAAELWELSPNLLKLLSDKDETSELIAIVEAKKLTPADIAPKDTGLVLVFDRPSSPGNLGSSIRSANAFGVDGIIVTGHAVDIYDPYVIRGSMGASFAVPVTTASSHVEVAAWVTKAKDSGFDFQIIGSSGKADKFIADQSFTRPTVLVMGNETVGMSRGYWDMCDAIVKIPISGALSSLNVSCAATVMLYEIDRQRSSHKC